MPIANPWSQPRWRSREARDKAYRELAKHIYDDIPTVPIGYPTFYSGQPKRLQWTPRIHGLLLVKEMSLTQ